MADKRPSKTFEITDRDGKLSTSYVSRNSSYGSSQENLCVSGYRRKSDTDSITHFPDGYHLEDSLRRAVNYRNQLTAIVEFLEEELEQHKAEEAARKAAFQAEREDFIARYQEIRTERSKAIADTVADLTAKGRLDDIAYAVQSLVEEHKDEDSYYEI